MEALAAIYRVRSRSKSDKYGSTWVKSQVAAVQKVKKNLEDGEYLIAVWTVEWRNPEAKYHLVYGDVNDPENIDGPHNSMAEQLRTHHLRKPQPNTGMKPEKRSAIVEKLLKDMKVTVVSTDNGIAEMVPWFTIEIHPGTVVDVPIVELKEG